MKKPKLVAALAALLALIGLGVVIAVTLWQPSRNGVKPPPPPPPPKPAPKITQFLPPPGGYHTAWLVAGPLPKALAAPGKVPSATEGKKLGGEPWRLMVSTESRLEISKEAGGIYYASGALESKAGGARTILFVANGKSRLWLNGKLLGASRASMQFGAHVAELTAKLKAGRNHLLVETRAGENGAALFLALREGDEEATEPMGLRLAAASRGNLAKLFAASLRLKRDMAGAWAEPGDTIELRLVRGSSAPRLPGQLQVKLIARPDNGKPVPGKTRKLSAAKLLSKPLDLTLKAPAGKYMKLECVAELTDPATGKLLATLTHQLFSVQGMRAAVVTIEADAREAAKRLGMEKVALPLLKAEKARLFLANPGPGAGQARAAMEELDAGMEALAAIKKGRDPLAGRLGWVERAYWSRIDESAQPYRLYVPTRLADPAERQAGKLPLVVYLHGWVPEYDKHYWVEERDMREMNAVMEKLGCILLMPFGRSNTDFVSVGEVDVLRAIDETCKRYPVDPDRVYLYGYSMGGYGAYAVATHFPDRFAATVVLAGRPEPYYIEQQAMAGLPRDKQPRYKGYCLDVDTPLELAANLGHAPTLIYHAQGDGQVPAAGAKRMAERLKESGAPVNYVEIKGDHFTGFDVMASPEPVMWMLKHKRPKRPKSVKLRTFSPRFGKSHWVRITAIEKWTAPAEIQATEDGGGHVRVTVRNVREFLLSQISAPKGLKISGSRKFEKEFDINAIQRKPGVWDVRGRLKRAPKEGRWRKTAKLAGPMKEACNTPFVVVYGAAGTKEQTADNRTRALRFATEWQAFAKGLPPVRSEKELSKEDKKTKSIILFCSASSSALLREAAPTLECRITDKEFRIAGRKASLEGDRGLVLTRPSPWAPAKDRYLVVCTGLFYGEDAAENHKLDLVPDFIVFTSGQEGEGEPPAVLAGYFDSDWKADPKLVETFAARKQPAPALFTPEGLGP